MMTKVLAERLCAEVEGEIVVFALGLRINKPWKVWRWLPVLRWALPMVREQESDPAIGLLSSRPVVTPRNIGVLQHWRSVEHLHAYAHQAGGTHIAAWRWFNDKIGTNGDVGIWHETYVVPAGHSESIFVNMPRYGLGLAGRLFPAKGERGSARKRLRGRADAAPLPGQG